jgi:maltose/maltodextrin transport system permease protein
LKKIAAHGFLIAFVALIMFPFLMIVSISFREGNFATGSFWPENPTLEHWVLAFGQPFTRADGTVVEPPYPVLTWMWNSVKISALSALGVLALSTLSAFAFSRVKFKGRQGLLDSLLIIQMFPTTLTLIALFAIFDGLGGISPVLGIDSHLAVILVYLSGICMHIWTLKGYFDGIDSALDEAAIMDGATPWQVFTKIYLPLAVPIMAVVFVLVFIGCINEYATASVLLRSEGQMTLAVGSRLYLNEFRYLWGDFAAAAILSGVPITIVFLIAQRYLVSGLSDGGVKG